MKAVLNTLHIVDRRPRISEAPPFEKSHHGSELILQQERSVFFDGLPVVVHGVWRCGDRAETHMPTARMLCYGRLPWQTLPDGKQVVPRPLLVPTMRQKGGQVLLVVDR